MTAASAFFSEFLGSAMLLFGILVMTDKKNAVPSWFVPIGLFITLLGIGAGMGFETGILFIACSMPFVRLELMLENRFCTQPCSRLWPKSPYCNGWLWQSGILYKEVSGISHAFHSNTLMFI